ncbi:MAG: Ig-like domain-containing protein [Caldimonas sp.]
MTSLATTRLATTRLAMARIARALVASIAVAGMAACGGGGGGGAPPPVAATTLGPAAGSVASSDGMVTVSVGDNALQAPAPISIEPATPDAATAADPSLVPGTTYLYTAPDLQVPEQVMITIESPLAASAAQAPDRKHALALPPGYVPPPTCLVNAPGLFNPLQEVRNITVTGTECPQSPAPACIKIFDVMGHHSVCAPAMEIIFVPPVFGPCPANYREVTGAPEFTEIAANNGTSRICQRDQVSASPVLGKSGSRDNVACSVKNGKFLCPATKFPSGLLSIFWDKTPPPQPTFTVGGPFGGQLLAVPEVGVAQDIHVSLHASDPDGIGGIVLDEVVDSYVADSDSGYTEWQTVQRWKAPQAQFEAATPVKQFDSGDIVLPYTPADPLYRRFRVRVFDKAGNSTASPSYKWVQRFTPTTTIDSFTVTPSTVQLPGGPVTLAWHSDYTSGSTATIDNGVGVVPQIGSKVVDVAATTTFTLTITNPSYLTKSATATVTLGADATPPTVSLAASPANVVAPGSTMLTATANDLAGVTKVEFYRGATLIGTDTTAPYEQTVAFTPADIGSAAFTAKAFDAANNNATSAVLTVTIGADVTPPTISLLANPATVLVPGSTTLQAIATDAIGVTKVEFWRGATLIATDTTAPYQTTLSFTAADLGTVGFTAKAFDAQNNNTTSPVVNVLVTTPSAGDTYASPTGVDAGNNSCSQAAPCQTIAKAAQLAQAGKTVWLMNGDYTVATQPQPIPIPAGLTLRALTPGLAGVGQGIVLQGDATVVGVVVRRISAFLGDQGWIEASSGTVTLDGVKVIGSAFTGGGGALMLSGTVHVTMSPGNIADYADQLSPAGQGAAPYASLTGSAWLTVNGGTFGGAGLGGSADAYPKTGAFTLGGTSRLDLNNAIVGVDSYGVVMNGTTTQLHMSGSTLHANLNSGFGVGVFALAGSPQISLVSSTISGFTTNGGGSRGIGIGPVGNVGLPGVAATVTVANASLMGNDLGVWVFDGTTPSSLSLTGTNLTVGANTFGGVVCYSACAVDIAAGEVSQNGTQNPALVGGYSFYGGLWFGSAAKDYQVKLRNVQVIDNKSLLGGNSNQPGNSGITMAGTAASSYDLGTLASPGGNLFLGNTTGNLSTGINVEVAAGVTVNAAGNSFAPNLQQADAQGKYKLGTSPCGSASCNLTAGTGTNYRIISGTLRLAQ